MAGSSIYDLAIKYGSDKAGKNQNYCSVYEKAMEPYIFENITLIELGVDKGASIKMWLDYFKSAKIIGIDKYVDRPFYDERFYFIQGGQTDETMLTHAVALAGMYPIRFIIDDASHKVEHQKESLDILWPSLAPGGIYYIEDLTANRQATSEIMLSLLMRFRTTGEFYNKQIQEEIDKVEIDVNANLGILKKRLA
jgi:hypothetical protein